MYINTGKVTAAPTCAMKAYRGSKRSAPLILHLSSRWRGVHPILFINHRSYIVAHYVIFLTYNIAVNNAT
jgi:hypothetical protein